MSVSGQYAGIWHRAPRCRDDVEAFCGAKISVSGLIADGAECGFGEEAGVLGFGGGAFGGLGGMFGGFRWFGGLRWIEAEGETSEDEGGGELRDEGFAG